jgi:hypothetical protein
VVSEIGQVGTQFDTFSHQMFGASMYNCVTLDQVATRTGFSRLGVEKVGALITRGVPLDVAALKRVPVLRESYEITVKDPRTRPATPCRSTPAGARSRARTTRATSG